MKVNLGRSEHKKSYFPITLDSSTTANFGECIPKFCQEVPPNTHVSLQIGDAVRFAPLSFPTFGKAFMKTYAFAHKLSDLYPPFKNMLSQTPYTSFNGLTYVPTKVPSIPLYYLWLAVLANCNFTIYRVDTNFANNSIGDIVGDKNNSFEKKQFTITDVVTQVGYTDTINIPSNGDVTYIQPEDVSSSLILWLTQALDFGNENYGGVEINSANRLLSYLTNSNRVDNFGNLRNLSNIGNNFSFIDYSEFSNDNLELYGDLNQIVKPDASDYIFYLPDVSKSNNLLGSLKGFYKSVYADDNETVVDTQYQSGYIKFGGEFNTSNQPDYINNDGWFEDSKSADSDSIAYIVCMRLNDSGKYLRKIFMGLGYQIAPLNTPVSILPIYAYFKSYFDTFAPKRFIKFDQTYFYRLINYCINTGIDLTNVITQTSTSSIDINKLQFGFSSIIDDLLSCYYTKDTDYFSSQIIDMINDYGNSLNQSYIGVDDNQNLVTTTMSSGPSSGVVPSIDFNGDNIAHTQAQQNILSRLTQFVNRRSVIGGKISELLKSVFGISSKDIDDYNGYVGSNNVEINFSDVFSTAETAEASLGEYAGKALASGGSDVFNINTDIHTLVLAFSVIVPRTQYVQGLNPLLTHVSHDDFYNPMFDGLTLLPTRKSALYCGDILQANNDGAFGNIPIYSEYKTKSCGILSGDLSLRSTKSTYDSFTMDEIISSYDYSYNPVNGNTSDYKRWNFYNIQYSFNNLVAGTMWRYLGRWLWLGRFDRIFVNNRLNFFGFVKDYYGLLEGNGNLNSTRNTYRNDDNMICHSVVNMTLNSAMVPLSGSWMTDDMLSLDSNGIKVQSE